MRERAVPAAAAVARVVALHATVGTHSSRPSPGQRGTTTCCVDRRRSQCSAAAALAYPRVRAGARAALAASLGVLAIEGAVLAIYDARAVGARAEDWSGFLLAPVGLLLAAWQSCWCGGRASRAVCATCAAWGSSSRPRSALTGSWAARDGDRRDAPAEGRVEPWTSDVHMPSDAQDERRPRPRGLVRPFAERRSGHLVPDPAREVAAGAHARPPRLRRAPPRHAGLRRERGRRERTRLGRRRRTSTRLSRGCNNVPTSRAAASAASGSPSEAR